MAMYLRRVVASNSARFRILSRGGGGGSITNTESGARTLFSGPLTASFSPPRSGPVDSVEEYRRGFAEGRNSSGVIVVADTIGGLLVNACGIMSREMDAAVRSLNSELSKLWTRRASAGMLDEIIVERGGVKAPLNRIAVVEVMDSKTLSVNPFYPGILKELENSILSSPLGLNSKILKELENSILSSPLGLNSKVDGERLIAAIPPLTKEHIQAISKVVARSCEDARQSIKRARQKALDSVKWLGSSLHEDDVEKTEKQIDDMTRMFLEWAEDMCKAKEKEIASGLTRLESPSKRLYHAVRRWLYPRLKFEDVTVILDHSE